MVGIPWRLALALQADGWWLRRDIVWHKTNAKPETAKDRPSCDHEYLFLMSKNWKYFYDIDAIREPHKQESLDRARRRRHGGKYKGADKEKHGAMVKGNNYGPDGKIDKICSPGGRSKRTVWSIPTQPFPEAHFATFPEKLVEPCLLAGSRKGDLVMDPFMGDGTEENRSRRNTIARIA